jgi:hypothetical protein
MIFKNILIGIAIAIILPFMMAYGINVFYEAPEYSKICNNTYDAYPKMYPIATNCSTNPRLDLSAQNCMMQGALVVYRYDSAGCPKEVVCDFCQKQFEEIQKEYGKKVFIISNIFGLILIIAGGLLFSIEAIGAGLIGGGIITMIRGNAVYWNNLDNLFKFIILLVALIVVLYVAIRMNKNIKIKKKKN